MAEAEAKIQNAAEVKEQSFGSDKSGKNIGTDGEEKIERWDGALLVERQSEVHPAFADCVEVRRSLESWLTDLNASCC